MQDRREDRASDRGLSWGGIAVERSATLHGLMPRVPCIHKGMDDFEGQ